MDQQGVAYRANVASTGRVSGYSFAVPDKEKFPDEWVWFKASQLGKDLAWSKMQTRLDAPLPEPKITVPEKKLLETRSRHRERVEAARNQARAKDLRGRRINAPYRAEKATQDEMKGRALRWRQKQVQSERTKYPSRRAELARLKKIRDTAKTGRPDLTASQLRSAFRAPRAREQRYQHSQHPPRETTQKSHGISR